MRIHLMGANHSRTPFAYPVYRSLFERRFTYVQDPAEADTIIFSYARNLSESGGRLQALIRAKPDLKVIVVSEEPLWDTTNSGDFRKRHNVMALPDGHIPYSVINHHTSQVYAFRRFPYFVTTDDQFYLRYSRAFSENARETPKALLHSWEAAPIRYAFFAENRNLEKKYSVSWPEIATWGLSVYRTDVAKGMPDKGTMRVGAGWSSTTIRQQLPDWHLDKLTTLRGRSMIISAIENTNQRDYVSEKIFDAFAARGIPLYWASPNHRVDQIAPPESYLNLYDLAPSAAVEKIVAFAPDLAVAEAHMEAQRRLAERFRHYDDFLDERFAFAERLSDEVFMIVNE
ncbi:glycosyltransferase family 10 [Pseudotabrizicola sp. 4114]|uniref:glycosyltransferase family 10 domain-containing protein n=1 Tax=Pseudotabrizicola sp. 4114 TaxID=2817731 RepID=UPI00285FE3BA|nr:hypothetical protein [Pseudorhodobacter sp. 4114]